MYVNEFLIRINAEIYIYQRCKEFLATLNYYENDIAVFQIF